MNVIVIATYNEAETIGEILEKLKGDGIHIVVVDDSSPDGTGVIASKYDYVSVYNRTWKRGIASAYYDGFMIALGLRPEYIIQMDAGLTHKPIDAGRMLNVAMQEINDLTIGARFWAGYERTGYRTLISLTAAWLMRVAGIYVTDATNGFRVWRADLLRQVIADPFESHGFAFQLETLARAHALDANIAEIPIEYRRSNSSFRPWMLIEALRIYFKIWRNNG